MTKQLLLAAALIGSSAATLFGAEDRRIAPGIVWERKPLGDHVVIARETKHVPRLTAPFPNDNRDMRFDRDGERIYSREADRARQSRSEFRQDD